MKETSADRLEKLSTYLEELYRGNRNRRNYDAYADILATANPSEVNGAIHSLIENHDDFDRLEEAVARFIRAAGTGLDSYPPPEVPPGHFLGLLLEENRALKELQGQLSAAFKDYSKTRAAGSDLKDLLQRTLEVTSHYRKLQYPVFSAMEKYAEAYNCTKLMWHIQDSVLAGLKDCIRLLESPKGTDFSTFNRLFGRVYLQLGTLVYREEKILFPVVLEAVPEEVFAKMFGELEDYGTSFGVDVPVSPVPAGEPAGGEINLSVGSLLPEQIDLMLKNLPVDITYVDENDRVRYYSQGKERIFPRSPGIIGRSVQNCHPPKSVHVVQKIVEDFKARRREVADFWLELGGNFIYIRYFALFEGDAYKGVLEVSQNVTDIRKLEGEKRLLEEE
jgi:uncharacterized protein